MGTTWLLLFLLCFNLIVALLYLLRMVHRKPECRKRFLLESLFMILCPIVGILFLFLCFLNEQIYFRHRRVDDLSFFAKDKKSTFTAPDWETESNIVPLEEALLVSGKENKRKELLHILKTDYRKSLSSVTKALEDPDSETSHYAASILMQEKSEIQMYIQELQGALRDHPEENEVYKIYMDYLTEILHLKIFSDTEQKNYLFQLHSLMEDMEKRWPGQIDPKQILDLGKMLIHWGYFDKAETWMSLLGDRGFDTLESYEMQLRYYYVTRQKHQFFNTLESMKRSDLTLNKEMLELVRYFSWNGKPNG